jgi:hypothetical protein
MKQIAGAGALIALMASAPSPSAAADASLFVFRGGIGATPVIAGDVVTNTPLPNDVLGIAPGGRPWVIQALNATVRANGDIQVDGRGLVLAGGNAIGTSGGQSVFASFFCNGQATPEFNTQAVQLAANGDFKIKGTFAQVPPTLCATPVLLIRSSANGNWFAAGVLANGTNGDQLAVSQP